MSTAEQLAPSKDYWPLTAILVSTVYMAWPYDWLTEWDDVHQRHTLLRNLLKVLAAPFWPSRFTLNLIGDFLCSLSQSISDLTYSACIYATLEAFGVGEWHETLHVFEHPRVICTYENVWFRRMRSRHENPRRQSTPEHSCAPPANAAALMLAHSLLTERFLPFRPTVFQKFTTVLPFWIRLYAALVPNPQLLAERVNPPFTCESAQGCADVSLWQDAVRTRLPRVR